MPEFGRENLPGHSKALPRIQYAAGLYISWCEEQDLNLHAFWATAPKAAASANSAILAQSYLYHFITDSDHRFFLHRVKQANRGFLSLLITVHVPLADDNRTVPGQLHDHERIASLLAKVRAKVCRVECKTTSSRCIASRIVRNISEG